MKSLYLSWRSPTKHKWFPVGKLTKNGGYEFEYVKGATNAREECGFVPLENFPNLETKYTSEELFPLFSNRLMPKKRPEYPEYLEYMNLNQVDDDPIVILARSGGRSMTDTYELFPMPELEHGKLHIHFFSHGVTHLPDQSISRLEKLKPGENLKLMHDFQNQYDPSALCLRTDDTLGHFKNDLIILGYVPVYFSEDVLYLSKTFSPEVKVERVNRSPAPLRFRLLCNLTVECPDDFSPFQNNFFKPLRES